LGKEAQEGGKTLGPGVAWRTRWIGSSIGQYARGGGVEDGGKIRMDGSLLDQR